VSTGQANTGAGLRVHRPTRRDDVMTFHGDGRTVPPLTFSTTIKDMKAMLHNA
jgi:hypothetical protein